MREARKRDTRHRVARGWGCGNGRPQGNKLIEAEGQRTIGKGHEGGGRRDDDEGEVRRTVVGSLGR